MADPGHRRGRVRIGRLDAAAPRAPGRRRGPGRRPDHRVLGAGDLRLDRPAARKTPATTRPDPARRTAGGAELADLARLAEEMRNASPSPTTTGITGFEDRQVPAPDHPGRRRQARRRPDSPLRRSHPGRSWTPWARKPGRRHQTQRQRHHDALEELPAADRQRLPARPGRTAHPDPAPPQPRELNRQTQTHRPDGSTADDCQPKAQGGGTQAAPPGSRETRSIWRAASAQRRVRPLCTSRSSLAASTRISSTSSAQKLRPHSRRHRPGPQNDQQPDPGQRRRAALRAGPDVASLLRTGALAATAHRQPAIGPRSGRRHHPAPHLRRAVILRDRHCAAPGCFQPPSACHVHHTTPRSRGGRTRLTELIFLARSII